jgi:hypothetical protein
MNRTERLMIWMTREELARCAKLAAVEDRTLSSWARIALQRATVRVAVPDAGSITNATRAATKGER